MELISKINIGGIDYAIRDKVLEEEVSKINPIVNQGTINNAADEEDLTSENNLLKLKDRSTIYGMGYIILRKNKSFAEQVTKENTIYEIRYNFTLSEDITIPTNCVLKFNGGSINGNGENKNSITLNNTTISGKYKIIDVFLYGTMLNEQIDVSQSSFYNGTENLADLISCLINNTNVRTVFIRHNIYVSKAIQIKRNFITLKALTKETEVRRLGNNVETFTFQTGDTLSAITPLVVCQEINQKMPRMYEISNITLLSIQENVEGNQYGAVVIGKQFNIKDCIIQGINAGLKGYGAFIFTLDNIMAQSSSGAAFDFSEFMTGINTTTANIKNCYAIGSYIGYYFNYWVYSTALSLACDRSTECAYMFKNSNITCIGLGTEGSYNNIIKTIDSKVRIDGFNLIGYKGVDSSHAMIEMSNSIPSRIALLDLRNFIANLDYNMDINDGTVTVVNVKNFNLSNKTLLLLSNCTLPRENVNSTVLGAIKCSDLFGVPVSNIDSIYNNTSDLNFADKTKILYPYNVQSLYISHKNLKNVHIITLTNKVVSIDASDGYVLDNTDNVIIENMLINIRNTSKLFKDNSIHKNLIFKNCSIIDLANTTSIIKDSDITFDSCDFIFSWDSNITNSLINAENSDIKFVNCTHSDPINLRNGIHIVSGNKPNMGNTRPRTAMPGDLFFDTSSEINKPIWWTGSKWVDATGASV